MKNTFESEIGRYFGRMWYDRCEYDLERYVATDDGCPIAVFKVISWKEIKPCKQPEDK